LEDNVTTKDKLKLILVLIMGIGVSITAAQSLIKGSSNLLWDISGEIAGVFLIVDATYRIIKEKPWNARVP
jgi:hypothetical protein